MKRSHQNSSPDFDHDNPDNWRGIFYFNRKDPRVIVPKLNPSMGWTLNFRNIYSYVLIVLLILIIVGFSYFLK